MFFGKRWNIVHYRFYVMVLCKNECFHRLHLSVLLLRYVKIISEETYSDNSNVYF